jgi:hypothetical protein
MNVGVSVIRKKKRFEQLVNTFVHTVKIVLLNISK